MSLSNLFNYSLLLTHGAGADKDSEWMTQMRVLLHSRGIEVYSFNFPYMQQRLIDGKKRPPDRMPKLLDFFAQQLEMNHALNKKIVIGGKSMGGRVASLLAADEAYQSQIAGVVCFGFPFHPPKQSEKYRGEHLREISTPTLILQGDRDPFGTQVEVAQFVLSNKVTLNYLPDGDHDFKPRVRSGITLTQNLNLAAEQVCRFFHSL